MVSGTDLFLGLFNNLALFIVLVAVYGFLIDVVDQSSASARQALIGLSFGLFAIACMHAKIPVADGVIVDQRNTIVTLGGAFGGPLSAMVSAFIAAAYRIYLGGAGAVGGVVGLGMSALAGTVLYKLRGKIDSVAKALFSALAATIVILPGFLFFEDLQTGWDLLKLMALPYGSAVFIGMFFGGLLLARQEHSHHAKAALVKSERRLRESEQSLDLALSGANEGIWDWNLGDDTVVFDARFYMISGYSPNEFPSTLKEWRKRVHPNDIQRVRTSIRQYLSGEIDSYDTEFRFLHKDGHYMWLQGKGKVVARTERGEPLRFIGTHSDITPRKTIEDSLRVSQFIVDKASIGIYRIGADARILDVNRQAAIDLGYSVEELCGMSIFDIDAHLKRDEWGEIWQALCDSGLSHFERTHRRKDGSEKLVEITANLLSYGGRQFSVAFTQDITERKVWENNLRASEGRYQDLFHRAPVGYVVTDNRDEEPTIKDVNDAFLELLGYRRQDVLGAPLTRFYTESSRKQLLEGDYQRALRGTFLREERDLLTRDNKIVNTIMHVHPIFDAGNAVTGTRAMYLDNTDRRQAEKEARRLQSALMQAQKMEAIGTLAGGIAHDFNNILGAIVGYTQLVQMNAKEHAKVQEYTNQVCIASERAKGLIQQILAFSRQTNLEKQPLDLGLITMETLKLIRASIPSTIDIVHHVKTNIGTVSANQTQIHQVLLNLCTNAAHAMENGCGTLTIDLLPVTICENDRSNFNDIQPGSYLQLTVADTGQGMDAYTVSRIFEPYFTTKKVGEGTGMGLALVHGIVTDHGGDIKVCSEPGVGTTFQLLFPAIPVRDGESITTAGPVLKGKERVLFVDDEKPLVDIGKGLLEILGYQVDTRTRSTDALEAVREKPDGYDIVITDMTMPEMNGDDLAAEIKKIRPTLPIIICTGFSKSLSHARAIEMGIDSILMKPLTLADLAETIRRSLDGVNRPHGR